MSTDKDTTVAELRELIASFVRERNWEQFHDPKNLSMAIATEAAELMEHFRWVHSKDAHDHARSPSAEDIADELSDVLAFALAFANAADIDITTSLRKKMVKNAEKYPSDEFQGKY